MKKTILVAAAFCLLPLRVSAQHVEQLDSAAVSATRAGEKTPVVHTSLGREELRAGSPMASLPMALSLQPSVVVSNEGGTGLGYSKMTVRGVRGAQTNVTLNGVTLNDAESQEVFWVNIPMLSELLSGVQLQRGLGTSVSGSGTFGASIHMQTASVGTAPHGSVSLSAGSWGTVTSAASFSSGLFRKGFFVSGALTKGDTDGWIRNAWADVYSAYLSAGWLGNRHAVRLTWLRGSQHTGITWNGIDASMVKTRPRYNEAGAYEDALGNTRYYDNESDNYLQDHLQAHYTFQLSEALSWITTLDLTLGKGYYEQYKAGKRFSRYGFDGGWTFTRDGIDYDASSKGDFVVRKMMDNHCWAAASQLRFRRKRLEGSAGLYLSRYDGDHYGVLRWSSILGDSYDYSARNAAGPGNAWYFNNGLKQELNFFARAEWTPLRRLTLYGDVQYRGIRLDMEGVEDEAYPVDWNHRWSFFNPRAGVNLSLGAHRLAASIALGHREPGRSDLKEYIASLHAGDPLRPLRPEKMLDAELYWQWQARTFSTGLGLYAMEYWDMLLETGRLSASGYPVKNNVDRAYRRGLEWTGAWSPLRWMRLSANATLSLNRILRYHDSAAVIDNESDWNELGYSVVYKSFDRTDILLSPRSLGAVRLCFMPKKGIELCLDGKYVGRQYLDNTSDAALRAPASFVTGASAGWTFPVGGVRVALSAFAGNLFSTRYYVDGGAWKYYVRDDDKFISGTYVYPQPPRHFILRCRLSF